MTQADMAKKAGLTRQAISYKVKRGMSHAQILAEAKERKALAAKGQRNKNDKGSHLAGVKKHKSKIGRPAGSVKHRPELELQPENFNSASLRKEIALANLKELEEAQKRAELIPVAQVNNFVASALMRARDIFSGIRDLSDRIRQEADAISAQLMVDAEMKRGFEELERFCEKMGRQVAAGEGVGAMSKSKEAA